MKSPIECTCYNNRRGKRVDVYECVGRTFDFQDKSSLRNSKQINGQPTHQMICSFMTINELWGKQSSDCSKRSFTAVEDSSRGILPVQTSPDNAARQICWSFRWGFAVESLFGGPKRPKTGTLLSRLLSRAHLFLFPPHLALLCITLLLPSLTHSKMHELGKMPLHQSQQITIFNISLLSNNERHVV